MLREYLTGSMKIRVVRKGSLDFVSPDDTYGSDGTNDLGIRARNGPPVIPPCSSE